MTLIFVLVLLIVFFAIGSYLAYQTIKRRSVPFFVSLCALVFFVALLFTGQFKSRPILLKKSDIVGIYKIDTSFFPGKNANWQKEHFWFEIKSNDELIIHEVLDDGTATLLKGKVIWVDSSPDKWKVKLDNEHHVFSSSPTLFRGASRFYYVLQSPKFGNMFFRKVDVSAKY